MTKPRNEVAKSKVTQRGWFCKVRRSSWTLMKKRGLFGVSEKAYVNLSLASSGDILVVYVGQPVYGIVGFCKITSEVFRDDSPLWRDVYPWRVRIDVLADLTGSPLEYSKLSSDVVNEEFEVTPYFLGKGLIPLSALQIRRAQVYLARIKAT